MDPHSDGIVFEVKKGPRIIFKSIDLGGRTVELVCDTLIKTEREYNFDELKKIATNLKGLLEKANVRRKKLDEKIETVTNRAKKEIDHLDAKMIQTETDDKRRSKWTKEKEIWSNVIENLKYSA